jgi:hypothetical protein
LRFSTYVIVRYAYSRGCSGCLASLQSTNTICGMSDVRSPLSGLRGKQNPPRGQKISFRCSPERSDDLSVSVSALRRSLSNLPRPSHPQSPSQLRACRGLLSGLVQAASIRISRVIENLSIRGCRIRSTTPVAIGSRLELEFQHSNDSFPITIEEAVVRSSADGAIGLRFTRLHRSEERRIRQLIDVWLPELLPSSR